MSIRQEDKSPTEVLMSALEVVEGATKVVILIEDGEGEALILRTNCTYRDLHWLLSQGLYICSKELFNPSTED